ncbi:FkbM family methyltransferase [Micromonospora sp. WMMD1082]|uniref:FkbM family methyltransferase n=1 Tax=Micromonospora sp. WMMD1082 TaxID=3016104 RepID=UPI0024168D7A|nr:FkbM family methyltransferase [Micromonospora sp. WMMD1082]MDG4797030.1 FkbM family methyltransferase [Micromonospora sp. WMMD1082]
MRLPNGCDVAQLNAGETSLMYRNIVTGRAYLQHGVTLTPGGTVFDVGANVGIASLFFHWEAGSRVLAFEPAPRCYQALAANFAEHGVRGAAYPFALSDRSGSAVLTNYPEITAMTSFHADREYDEQLTRTFLANSGFDTDDIEEMVAGRHHSETLTCELRTFSDVADELGGAPIDLVKINVEKAEVEVLRGIAERHWPAIRQVVVQLHDIAGRLHHLRQELTGRGYRVGVAQDPLLTGTDIVELFAVRTHGGAG